MTAGRGGASPNGSGSANGVGPGSGPATARPRGRVRPSASPGPVVPGEVLLGEGPVPLNPGRPVTALRVLNTGDRPVQIGSHLHFPAANDALDFDRAAAWGRRLHVPAGTAVRFEPGVVREVELVPIAGARVVPGLKDGRGGTLDAVAPAPPTEADPADGAVA